MADALKNTFLKGLEAIDKTLSSKVLNFRITLDNPLAVYFAGETITGKVELELTASESVRGIYVDVIGEAHISFYSFQSKKNFSEKEVYCQQTITVCPSSELNPGVHSYPFSVELPRLLPSSFEAKKGQIRYHMKAYSDRQWKVNRTARIVFTVNSFVDLNVDENMKKPSSATCTEIIKKMFSGKPVTVSMSTNRYGYVAGEDIEIDAEVVNDSGRPINITRIDLIQTVTFQVHRRSFMDDSTVNTLQLGQVPKCNRKEWKNARLKILPVPPTTYQLHSIITIQYHLRMMAITNDNSRVTCDVPIFIGTIPLQSSFPSLRPAPVPPSWTAATEKSLQPSAPEPNCEVAPLYPPLPAYNLPEGAFYPQTSLVNPSAANHEPQLPFVPPTTQALYAPYPDMPPPSYEESVFGAGAVRQSYYEASSAPQGNGDVLQYTPRYITYHTINNSESTAPELPQKH